MDRSNILNYTLDSGHVDRSNILKNTLDSENDLADTISANYGQFSWNRFYIYTGHVFDIKMPDIYIIEGQRPEQCQFLVASNEN